MCTCVEVINHGQFVARKKYSDDGWEDVFNWVDAGMWTGDKPELTFEEKLSIACMVKTGSRHIIEKGELYIRQFNKMEGDTYTWRTKKVFYDLIVRYDLFAEC